MGSGSRRGAGGRQGLAGQRVDAPSEARGADGSRAGRHPPAHTATRHHRCGGRRRDRRARAGFETTHRDTHQHASRRRCGGRRRDPWAWLRCPWAVAGPGRHHTAPKAPPAWRAPEGPVGLTAVPVGGGGAWPGFETTRRAKLAARTARGRATAHGRRKQPGPEQQREGRCTRYGPLHPLRAAAPVTGRCTRSEEVHCLRIGCSTPNHKNKRGICETRARLRHPWAAAGPGRASRRRAEPKARGADGSRAGHRPRAHQAARPNNTPRGARNASGATRNTAQGRGPTGPRP